MSLTFPDKDPDEVLDYQLNWAARLGADTISTSTWTVPEGITQDSASRTDTTTTLWLSGGTSGQTYALLNRIVTVGGRTMDQTVSITLADR
jgi:hypothetical protein